MPSGPKKRKNAKKKKETALHVGAPTNIPEEVGGDDVKVVLEKSGGGVVVGRDVDGNDEDASWDSKQTKTDSSDSTVEEHPCLRSRDSIGETAEAVEVLKMDEKSDGGEEATVVAQRLEENKGDAGFERVEDGKISVELVEPLKVDEKGGSSSSSSRSSSSSSSDDGGSDSDRDKESEKQEVLPALKGSEKTEVLSGAPEESEKTEVFSGALEESEKLEVLSGALDKSEKAEVLSGALENSETSEVLSGSLENSETSEVLSGALENSETSEVLSGALEAAEEEYRIDVVKVEVPIESSGLESTIEIGKVTNVESVIVPDAAASSIESEKEVTVKAIDNPGLQNSVESVREEIKEALAMSSSTEVHQEIEQQAVIVESIDKPIVEPAKDNEKSEETERTLPPPIVRRTSWKGCCGLFDVFLGSNR
ncbi:uncharacterized protein LOC116257423 [Nymphaea colorata]|nr:uncharacterized protein LOC116257423 [Nymphaea colorata]XP_031490013.1 uncharacterized protein LOC116257423 [Nymphaea colorata]XP_031490014.1 uncharacterized protein LOC116257423 [Nymphaea colorata]